MRITIVKNDDFKTVGLHVETTNPGQFTPERVFSLGLYNDKIDTAHEKVERLCEALEEAIANHNKK